MKDQNSKKPAAVSDRKIGFTLIELLIVIAIIALLAAILFPVFARARENARRSSCQSNLKQIGLSIAQYLQDYDDRYMPTRGRFSVTGTPTGTYDNVATPQPSNCTPEVFCNSGSTWELYWQGYLIPYAKNHQIFRCPSDRYNGTWYYGDYGLVVGIGQGWVGADTPVTHAVQVLRPPVTYMVADWSNYSVESNRMETDYWRYLPGVGSVSGWACSTTSGPANTGDCHNGRHFNGINMLYADGHVKFQTSAEVYRQRKALAENGLPNSFNMSNPPA